MAIYDYQTEPITDFSKEENVKKYQEALAYVESYLGKTYPLIIGGNEVETGKLYTSYNPANHNEIIGYVHQANFEVAEEAMQIALKTFETWKDRKSVV